MIRPQVITTYRGGSHLLCALLGQNADGDAIYLHHVPANKYRIDSFDELQGYSNRIILIRDPRDICVGAFKRYAENDEALVPWIEQEAGQALYRCCEIWKDCQNEFIIRYEDLCRDPDGVQIKINEKFGIPLVPTWSKIELETISTVYDNPGISPIYTTSVGVWKNSPYKIFALEYAQMPAVKEFLEIFYHEY